MAASAVRPGIGRLAAAATVIAVLTVASRLAGFARNVVFTWMMGEDSDLGDMYVVANTVPNIIFEIVAGGALASLVVPLLAGAVAAGDRVAVSATTGALLTWTLTLLVPLAVVVAVLAEQIVGLLAENRPVDQSAVGARMLRIFAPQVPLYGVGIVLTGVLQAHRRFAWPVIAPLLSSLTVIGVYLCFAAREGVEVDVARVSRGGELILSVGTTLGVVVLSLCLLIPLRGLGLRLRPGYTFTAEARGKIGGLAVTGAVTVIAQQIALLAILGQVTNGPPGAAVVFNLAQTLYLLPWAVLAVPLAVAAYPALAEAHATGDEEGYRRTLAPTVRGVLLFSCLGAAALVATATPVARFFWADAAPSSSAAIAGFAPGLLGYGLFAVLSRALYARGATRPAVAATTLGWLTVPVAAVAAAGLFPTEYRVFAVALGNSVGMLLLGGLLILAVARSAGPAALAGFSRAAVVGVTAGAAAAAVGWLAADWLTDLIGHTPEKSGALLQGMLSAAVVVLVFLTVAYPLDRHDVRPMIWTVRRRLRSLTPRMRPDRRDPTDGRVDGKEKLTR